MQQKKGNMTTLFGLLQLNAAQFSEMKLLLSCAKQSTILWFRLTRDNRWISVQIEDSHHSSFILSFFLLVKELHFEQRCITFTTIDIKRQLFT